MSTSRTAVSIKGTKSGLQIVLDDSLPFDVAIQQLAAHLDATDSFFQGSRVALDVGERVVGRDEWSRLEEHLRRRNLILTAVLAGREESRSTARSLGIPLVTESRRDIYRRPRQENGGVSEGLVIRQTLRSGQIVRYPGPVVIIGDVNPGAEIIAEGDVIVWGSLRGVVHAGAAGDEKAIVGALHLAPTQLRLAGHVARSPGNQRHAVARPEVAILKDGRIVVEEWLSGHRHLDLRRHNLRLLATIYTLEVIILAAAIRLFPSSWWPLYSVAIAVAAIGLGWLVALAIANRQDGLSVERS